jgi:hypothetical protein
MSTSANGEAALPSPDRFLHDLALRLVGEYERASAAYDDMPDDLARAHDRDLAGGALLILLVVMGGIVRVGDTIFEEEGGRLRVRRGVPALADRP